MPDRAFALFETAIGPCGLVWSEAGIAGAALPERSAAATRARLLRRFPDAGEAEPTSAIARAVADIRALLGGERRDLYWVALDLSGVPPYDRRVYAVARTIPPGATLTYGEVAARIGEQDPRAVGAALGRNPVPMVVPCHRVLAAGGKTGGFSAPGGAETKRRMLAIEGVWPGGQPGLFDGDASRPRADHGADSPAGSATPRSR